jgi:UDP-N-acetylmuramate dehydrogenase
MIPHLKENVPLAPLTTLNVGGPARYFLRAETEAEVVSGFDFAEANDLPVFVLGGGSNLLVADRGFDGLVIQIALKGITVDGDLITAAAGEDWDAFVEYCVGRSLAGIECLSGIPGTVGGTPVQNVGAYGQEVSETIVRVRCYDLRTREILDLSNEECGFKYRVSIFNTTERDRFVVLAVTYRLTRGGAAKLAYKDVIDAFGDSRPSLAQVRERILAIRRAKSMVIDPSDPNSRSAGSFFKNPIISIEEFSTLQENYGESIPHFPAGNDSIKVPAAWLIEKSGFKKGFVSGHAGISSNHTLAIINRGGATAAEIVSLKNAIQNKVFEKFSMSLVPEPVCLGEF